MHVETAALSDIDTLVKLNRHVQDVHRHAAPHFFKEASPGEVAGAYREFLRQESVRGFIAYAEGRAVGYVLSVIRRRPEDAFCTTRTFVYVDQISVDPSYQG